MVARQIQLLSVAFVVIAVSVAIAAPESDKTPAGGNDVTQGSLQPRGSRRWIYNSDPSNTTRHLSEPAAQPDELRQVVRNYAREGHVDTLVQEIWHQCWTEFWRTDKCPYDTRPQHQRLTPIMDAGVMPIEIYIDECHRQNMEFVAGFRMNDRHGNNVDFFQTLDKEHPEWILKEYKPTGGGKNDPRNRGLGCSLDYSQQGVRDWLFSIMEEVAKRFDIDGIELSFHRMPECFPRKKAQQSHAIMTGFVRRVSAMLDETGQKKGRELILGVRVLQDIEQCKRWGLDVPAWIEQRLIHYVAPGDWGFTDFNAKYEEFVRLGRAHGCYVYPQAERRIGYPRWKKLKEEQTPEQYRAVVKNFYGVGADGFSTSNYFIPSRKEIMTDPKRLTLLKAISELRDPKMVVSGDRHYAFVPIWGPGVRYIGGTYPERIVLNRQRLGQRGQFRFRMCEDLAANSQLPGGNVVSGAVLFFSPSILPGDEIAVDINGHPIPAGNIKYEWRDEEGKPPLCSFALTSPPSVHGDNYLGLSLIRSSTGAKGDVTLDEVEVIVKAGN